MSDRRVWIGCLAAYNAGKLHGEWIESEGMGVEDLQAEVDRILAASPEPGAEEYFIADHEGYEGLLKGEPSLDEVADAEAALMALSPADDEQIEAFAAYVANLGSSTDSLEDMVSGFEDAYLGVWDSERDYAEYLIDETGELRDDSLLARYFDYDTFTRDLFMSDYWSHVLSSGGVVVFMNA